MKIVVRCVTKLACLAAFGVPALLPLPCRSQSLTPGEHAPAERSTNLTISVGGISHQLSPTALAALPQSHLTVHNSHNNRDEDYSGVSLADLLASAGLPFTKENQRTYLHSYIRAQGTDFYFVLYSAAEVQPELSSSNVLIATRLDGHDLGAEGVFKLVSSSDKRPARWVRNLLSLTLVTVN